VRKLVSRPSTRSWAYRVLVGAMMAAIFTGCAALARQSSPQKNARVSAGSVSNGAQLPGTPCSVNAVPQIQASDDPMGRIIPGFPPALLPGAHVQPLTLSQAEQYARDMRGAHSVDGGGPAPVDAPVTSIEEAYRDWAQQAGMAPNDLINPTRCVWVVTVQSTFVSDGPQGVTLPAHHSYTVIIDVGSHFIIGFTSPHP